MVSLFGKLFSPGATAPAFQQPIIYQPPTIEDRSFISASLSFSRVKPLAATGGSAAVSGAVRDPVSVNIPEISQRLNLIFEGILSGRNFSAKESAVVLKIAQEAFDSFNKVSQRQNITPAELADKRNPDLIALQEIYLKSAALVHSIAADPSQRAAAQEIFKKDLIMNVSSDPRPAEVYLPDLEQRYCDAYFSPGLRNKEFYQAYAQWLGDISDWVLKERADLTPALAQACNQRLTNKKRGGLGGIPKPFPGREVLVSKVREILGQLEGV